MHRETITVKVSCLHSKAHMIFHWCLYNKLEYWLIPGHKWPLIWEYYCGWPENFFCSLKKLYPSLCFHHPSPLLIYDKSLRMTETRSYEPARLSTPPKPTVAQTLLFTKTAGPPARLRSLLSKVFCIEVHTLSPYWLRMYICRQNLVMVQIRRKQPNAMNTLECKKVLTFVVSLQHFWMVLTWNF